MYIMTGFALKWKRWKCAKRSNPVRAEQVLNQVASKIQAQNLKQVNGFWFMDVVPQR